MGIVIVQPQRRLFKDRLGRVRRWVAVRLGAARHEQRVLQLATGLFNITAARHGLEPRHRRLLMLAALLHDVGRMHGADEHHVRGARMVRRSRTLALRASERRVVAYLARYHRGPMPDARKDWRHTKLENPRTMHLLLCLLRSADTLDSRHIATPAVTLRLKEDRLRIRCYVAELEQAERAFVRPKKFRPLEDMLNVRVDVQMRSADALSGAA